MHTPEISDEDGAFCFGQASRKTLTPSGGERGIRTPDFVYHEITAFEAAAFDHSAISP